MTSVVQVSRPWFQPYRSTLMLLALQVAVELCSTSSLLQVDASSAASNGQQTSARSMATPKKRMAKSSSSTQRRTSKTRNDYLVRGLEKVVPAFGEFRGTMYAGLIPTTPLQPDADDDEDDVGKSSLMFWLFAPHEPIYTDSMVVWMNGGPGCSSLGGSLFEQGPVTIPLVPAGQTTVPVPPNTPLAEQFSFNPNTWTQATAMLYLEHPVGTGFSINDETTPLRNETDVGRDVYNFLQNFYTIFGRPTSSAAAAAHSTTAHDSVDWRQKDLYLIGESYAGMYVPSIAHYIHQQNTARHKKGNGIDSASMSSNALIPLAGIAMGNGWMNALVQGPAVIEYAWWHGMIDSTTKAALHQEWDNCKMTSSDTDDDVVYRHHHHSYQSEPKPFHRFTVPDECGILEAVLSASGAGKVPWGAPNAYDVTTWDEYLMLDNPTGAIHRFYNDPAVQAALNIPNAPVPWVECMPGAGRRRQRRSLREQQQQQHHHTKAPRLPGQLLLDHDRPISVVPYVAALLDDATSAEGAPFRVLVYNGDFDMTTNSQGSEMLLDGMDWNGADGWAGDYQRGLWFPKARQHHHSSSSPSHTFGGYIKRYQNLDFLIVHNSGHLVPFNQPEIALDLITRFLGNQTFLDKSLPRFEVEPKPRKNPTKHDTLQESTTSDEDDDELRSAAPRATMPVINKQHTGGYVICWSIVIGLGGFLLGFLTSRGMHGRNSGYQVIPDQGK